MPLGVGEEFAGFTIIGRLGAGAMGEVYLAQHPRLPRRDALKLLSAEKPTDPSYRERFLREADAAAKLWHPHIVGVHDRGECDGRLWISMDFVDGEDAESLLNRRYPAGMPTELVVGIANAVASALDYAHRQGVLHRDIKPANIMLANAGDIAERRILLGDFGIARDREDVSGLTGTNMTVGTFAYCAPEQLMGGDIDGRADQYALAATAYHLLTGTTPFPGTNPAAVIGSHLNTPPPRLADSRPDLAGLDPVLAAALAKNPDDRFALCSDFAAALAEQASNASASAPSAPTARAPVTPAMAKPSGRPLPQADATHAQGVRIGQPVLVGIGLVALVLAGLIGFLVSRPGHGEPAPQPVPTTVVAQPQPTRAEPEPTTVTETATRTVVKTPVPAPAPPAPPPSRAGGDLGLSTPMSYPPCNGLGIVVLGSVTTPGAYASGVQRLLYAYPGSSYLRTDQSCPSLRQSSDDGNPIYAVYVPAGYSKAAVCTAVRQIGGGAYGRWLDTAISPDHQILC